MVFFYIVLKLNITQNFKMKVNLNYLAINSLFNYYMIFIFYFFINFLLINSFNFFKQIFINYNFFEYFNLINSKKNYLFYFIMFKKQNSLMKKKYNYYNNLYPLYFKKKIKKKLLNSWKYTTFTYTNINSSKFINILNGKKKFRKTILLNRLLFNYLNFNKFKTSKNLSSNLYINSKLYIINILLKLEYSLTYLIMNTNLIKSSVDFIKFLKLSYINLNRKSVFNPKLILNKGDLIELNLNYKLYNYINKFKDFNLKYIYKLKTKLWFKIKNYNKLKINYNENKIVNKLLNNNILFKNFIPNYIEIDFITLSLIIIYKSLNFNHYSYALKKILVIYMFKLYNWK